MASQLGRFTIPKPFNEPLQSYAPGSEEAKKLRVAFDAIKGKTFEVPCIVNGEEIFTGDVKEQYVPSDHKQVICKFHCCNTEVLEKAVDSALAAKKEWENLDFPRKAAILLKAAELLAGKYRYEVLAATMIGQGKNVWQAEIDAAAELIDFWRFNAKYAEQIMGEQPPENGKGTWNRTETRGLEGFIWALSPFNFVSIGGNLATAPALMGNVVIWKPASAAVYSNYIIMKILVEAGLPKGVINFLPGRGAEMSKFLTGHKMFAGLHFTGSTEVFTEIWQKTAANIPHYQRFPRIVGETGGKDFHFLHESCDIENAALQTIRGAFEYSGQKCSACSRIYVPDTIAEKFKAVLVEHMKKIKVGDPEDFSIFMTAVIDRPSYDKNKEHLDYARESPDAEFLVGGTCDDSKGFFVQPTVILTTDPDYKSIKEEIFGPILTMYVYKASEFEKSLELCNTTSPFGLTGAFFANDSYAIQTATNALRHAAGNFYVNDKCTGAVVGQQPFGGSRASGTNDKAGSSLNLLRWCSVRSIKENFIHLEGDFRYPSNL